MRKFKNAAAGPVDVPALGLANVEPGQVVEVDDTDIADGLEGSELWDHIVDPKRSKATKQAAATRAEDTSNDAVKES